MMHTRGRDAQRIDLATQNFDHISGRGAASGKAIFGFRRRPVWSGANLQHALRALERRLHLLLFDQAPGYKGIDGGFGE